MTVAITKQPKSYGRKTKCLAAADSCKQLGVKTKREAENFTLFTRDSESIERNVLWIEIRFV